MDYLFNNILAETTGNLSIMSAVATMAAAVLFGIIIAVTYMKTRETGYQSSFAVTLIMLPVILSVIIIFVGSNVARAFSLAGTLSIIRFRSAPGDPEDIGYIFFDIAAGLACGVGLYGYGLIFVIVLCIILFAVHKFDLFEKKDANKLLKITIPEDLNYDGAFDEVLDKYTTGYKLDKMRTTDLGSLFELCYSIKMPKTVNEQEFINELRCRNGNLNIILSVEPRVIK